MIHQIHLQTIGLDDLPSLYRLQLAAHGEHARSCDELSHLIFGTTSTGCWVAFMAGQPVGYAVYQLAHGCRRVVDIAIKPRWQNNGIGRRLVERISGADGYQMPSPVVAVVRETVGDRVYPFWAALGFRAELERRAFPEEDGYRFSRGLEAAVPVRAEVTR